MVAEELDNALARMEAALARIERAAVRPAAGIGADDGDLARRHDRLRAAVGDSLRDLDVLLAGSGQ